KLVVEMTPYSPRTFAVRVAPIEAESSTPAQQQIALNYDRDVVSPNNGRTDGDFEDGATIPAEYFPGNINSGGLGFRMGKSGPGEKNALVAKGQKLELPTGEWRRLAILAAAREPVE